MRLTLLNLSNMCCCTGLGSQQTSACSSLPKRTSALAQAPQRLSFRGLVIGQEIC